MALINSWFFTRTIIEWNKIASATHNQYRVASVRPYVDKKGVLPEGYSLTVTVMKDDFDYGLDKNGMPRENNVYQNFDVTVLSRAQDVKKGDIISLEGFDEENSFAIGFDMLLRFRGLKVLQPAKA